MSPFIAKARTSINTSIYLYFYKYYNFEKSIIYFLIYIVYLDYSLSSLYKAL